MARRNGTGSQSRPFGLITDAEPLPEHHIVYDGGDPLDRFVLRCACGFESVFFSYIAAARSMDAHLGFHFVPVKERKVTAEQVSA